MSLNWPVPVLKLRQILHLLRIHRTLVRHGLNELVAATHLFRSYWLLSYLLPWNWRARSRGTRAERLRFSLEELGPIFVKFGQILSTRRDLLPEDIAEELAKLQDQVPSFPNSQAHALIEAAYGKPLAELFSEFGDSPLASASIAQVYSARLADGRAMVVKVVRPGIEPVIKRDLALLYYLAQLAERFWRDGKRLQPVAVVREFEKVLFDELDLVREAANASQLRRNFKNHPLLYVPEMHWPLVTRNVITMERISGTPIGDIDTLKAKGIDLKRLAEHGVEIFYTQVFQHNFFHADMHPGNIFVEDSGRYIAVDFGIMGSLTEQDRRYLLENFIAFFNRNYRQVAELHVKSGWVHKSTRVDELESAIRAVCEPNFNKPLKDISFGQVLLRLFETARRFNMTVQPQLVLLQKTLLNIEGLGRRLYPDLDLWNTAKPLLERWMAEQMSLRQFAKRLRKDLPLLIEKLPDLPFLIHDYLVKTNDGTLERRAASDDLAVIDRSIQQGHKQITRALLSAAFLVSGTLIALSANTLGIHILWGVILGLGGLMLALSALRK